MAKEITVASGLILKIHARCFLSDETRVVSNVIENILQCALDFRSCLPQGTGRVPNDSWTNTLGIDTCQVKEEVTKFFFFSFLLLLREPWVFILFKSWNRWWWWSRSLRKRWRICICVTGDHQNMGGLGSLASGIASTSTFTIQRSYMTLTSSLSFLRNPISDILFVVYFVCMKIKKLVFQFNIVFALLSIKLILLPKVFICGHFDFFIKQ